MVSLLWGFAALNLAYILFALFKKKKVQKAPISEETRFIDIPDNMKVATVYPKIVKLNDSKEAEATQDWWDNKINSKASVSSRRMSKIEHDQYLLSDLGFDK